MAAAPRVRQARIVLAEQPLAFTLYCVPGRRNVHVLVNEEGDLEVRAPWRYSLAAAKCAVHEHSSWVLEQLKRQRAHLQLRPQLISGTRLPLLDERLELRFDNAAQGSLFSDPGTDAPGRVYREGGRLWVVLQALKDAGRVRGLLEAWYRQQAREILPQRMQPLACKLGVEYGRVSIRAQRTRWGSCSPSGAINLNWRLLLLPQQLCDYVLVHELSHLREMNHSARFWAQVASVIPDYPFRRRQLRQLSRPLAL